MSCKCWVGQIKARLDKFCHSLLSLFSPQPHISVPKVSASKKEHITPFCCQMLSYINSVWKNIFTKLIYCSHSRTLTAGSCLLHRVCCISVSPPTGETTYRQLKCLTALVLGLNVSSVKLIPICAHENATNCALLIIRQYFNHLLKCGSDWMLCKMNKRKTAGSYIPTDTGNIAFEH